MKVSVVIPTYNGAHKLPGIIEALTQQNFREFEVVVAIDGSTDNTVDYLNSIKPPFSLIILDQSNQGRSVIRNSGAEAASGDLLIFFDDDMLPLEHCIQLHVHHHIQYPGTILTGGLKENILNEDAEILKYRSFLNEKWIRPLMKCPEQKLSRDNLFISAANFSVEKRLFQKLGGFDARLNDAEDFDLAVRAYKGGVSLYFNYSAFAWHNDNATYTTYIKRQRQYTKAHRALMQEKPWLQSEGFVKKSSEPTGIHKLVFEFFSSSFWVNAADKGKLKVLPKSVRYKLYDLIITANGIYFPDKVKL